MDRWKEGLLLSVAAVVFGSTQLSLHRVEQLIHDCGGTRAATPARAEAGRSETEERGRAISSPSNHVGSAFDPSVLCFQAGSSFRPPLPSLRTLFFCLSVSLCSCRRDAAQANTPTSPSSSSSSSSSSPCSSSTPPFVAEQEARFQLAAALIDNAWNHKWYC